MRIRSRWVGSLVLSTVAMAGGAGGGCSGGGTKHPDAGADVAADRDDALDAVVEGGGSIDSSNLDSPSEAQGDDLASGDERAVDAPSIDVAGDALSRPDSLSFDGSIDGEQTTCNILENTAGYIGPVARGSALVPPVLHGGTIVDGRYELVAVDSYTDVLPRASVPSIFRRTVEFRNLGTEWQLVEVARTDASETTWTVERRTYSVTTTANATLIATSDPCSGSASAVTQYQYEAATDSVIMFFANSRLLLSYLRVP